MTIIDKLGAAAAFVSAFGIACCLPIFAAVSSAIGLSFLAAYQPQMSYLMQAAAVVAAAATLWSYRRHKKAAPGIVAVAAAAAIIYALNTSMNSTLIYAGLAGLVVAAVLNAYYMRGCGNCEVGGET